MDSFFSGIYKNKKVFLTGHTGFKGSWMTLWLNKLGAEVYGYSLYPKYEPSHYELLGVKTSETIDDIRNYEKLSSALKSFKPDMLIHMAAQPLVRYSYREPRETFETNIMGTVNVLNACREIDSIRAVINVTSDKCYENREWVWGYRENDPMGGHDPYSSSKGCAELATSAFRNSFFNIDMFGKKHQTLISSVRAGNVIGGGDWSDDRLIPDIVKAVSENEEVIIRSPESIRPWQHVLEPLSGYLMLGQKLLEGNKEFAGAWNFGPSDEESVSVHTVVDSIKKAWPKVKYRLQPDSNNPHEANLLKLDCSKAYVKLKWKGIWDAENTFEKTAAWYREFYENNRIISEEQLEDFFDEAIIKKVEWAH